jgi:putative hydrolase of the HAD superfamily
MLKRAQIEMVFFDAAGTLFDVRGSVGEIYARLARPYGVEVAPEEIQRRFARAFRAQPPMAFPAATPEAERLRRERDWWRHLVRAVFAESGEFPRFEEYFTEVYEFFRTGAAWRAFEDTAPTLTALRQRGLRLGIISNFDSRLDDVLRALGLDHYFAAVHLSSREGAAKPDPAIFRAALNRHALAPGAALHIGDSLREDAEAAAAAGMLAVWLDRREVAAADTRLTRLTRLDQLVGLLNS